MGDSRRRRLFVFPAVRRLMMFFFFFFNDTATTEIYTLPLHDALPISTLGKTSVATSSRRSAPGRTTVAPAEPARKLGSKLTEPPAASTRSTAVRTVAAKLSDSASDEPDTCIQVAPSGAEPRSDGRSRDGAALAT